MTADASSPSGNTPLQFDVAESSTASSSRRSAPTDTTCKACSRPIARLYFEVNSAIICESCRASLDRPSGTRFTRGLQATGLGLLAAIGGSLLYVALAAITGRELGLVAIAVGFIVGKAVRKGSRGRGGWTYQTLAVALTYFAIVSTYIPLVAKELQKNAHSVSTSARPNVLTIDTITITAREPDVGNALESSAAMRTDSGFSVMQSGSPASNSRAVSTHLDAGTMLLGLGQLVWLAAKIPILAGFSDVIGLVIIGIAVFAAWMLNRRDTLTITGPYRVAGDTRGGQAVA